MHCAGVPGLTPRTDVRRPGTSRCRVVACPRGRGSATSARADDADASPGPSAAVRASDADREAVVTRLQTRPRRGADRPRRVRSASRRRLRRGHHGRARRRWSPTCPRPPAAPVEIVGTRAPEDRLAASSVTCGSPARSVPQRVSTVFGDVRIDLRGLRTGADRVDLYAVARSSATSTSIVAEGVDAELAGPDRSSATGGPSSPPVPAAGRDTAGRRPRAHGVR